MQGTAVKFDIKHGDYGDYALGKMADDTGAVEKMFYAASEDSPLPDESVKNKLAVWGIRFDANKRQFKAYFNGLVQQQTQGHQGNPQQSQQGTQQAAQGTNLPQGGDMLHWMERITFALEKIAAKGESFEQKYNIPSDEDIPL